MAAGPEILGLVYFATVKCVGYTAAASFLKRKYPWSRVHPLVAGGVRTAIGIVVGVGAVLGAEQLGLFRSTPGFYAFLAPVRILEWLFLLWLFFERPDWTWSRALKWAAVGAAWSYVLDLPAILAVFLIPGGMWIC